MLYVSAHAAYAYPAFAAASQLEKQAPSFVGGDVADLHGERGGGDGGESPRLGAFSGHRPGAVGASEGGRGFSVNVAWSAEGCGDAEYAAAWQSLVLPLVRERAFSTFVGGQF